MMNTVKFSGITLNVDLEKTKDYYNNLLAIDQCMCDYCKNYRKAVQAPSKAVLSIFNMFGIDYMKADEISECGGDTKNHLYFCSYYFCGEIVTRENSLLKDQNIKIDEFKFSLNKEIYVDLKELPLPALQLQVYVKLPWVI